MERAEVEADQMPGQDSFLDVITNIVGVLILLVLVVGLRSSRAVANSGHATALAAAQAVEQEKLRDAFRTAANTESEVVDLVRRSEHHRQETLLREQERLWLAETVAEHQLEVTARRAKLNENEQRDFDLRRKLVEAQMKLDALTREQVALLAEEPEVEKIECQPTPLARTVTGKEIHVQLCDDYVACIPTDELIKLMYDDFDQNSWRLKDEDEMVRTIGPIDGIRLQYCFIKKDVVARGRNGVVASGKAAEFQGFFLLPDHTPLGEPATDAMAAGSEFRRHLQQVDATRTTITIWTYPGNYERLRELRRLVRELGFQVAIRPLPTGKPIGFSPTGSKSVSE